MNPNNVKIHIDKISHQRFQPQALGCTADSKQNDAVLYHEGQGSSMGLDTSQSERPKLKRIHMSRRPVSASSCITNYTTKSSMVRERSLLRQEYLHKGLERLADISTQHTNGFEAYLCLTPGNLIYQIRSNTCLQVTVVCMVISSTTGRLYVLTNLDLKSSVWTYINLNQRALVVVANLKHRLIKHKENDKYRRLTAKIES